MALSKIYFSPIVIILAKIHLYKEAPSLIAAMEELIKGNFGKRDH